MPSQSRSRMGESRIAGSFHRDHAHQARDGRRALSSGHDADDGQINFDGLYLGPEGGSHSSMGSLPWRAQRPSARKDLDKEQLSATCLAPYPC